MKMEEYLNEKNLGSLLEYLYPNGEWIHNKNISKETFEKRAKKSKEQLERRMFRPDYRNEELSLIVEFDGLDHYQSAPIFWNDIVKKTYYESLGYKFIQIPYYLQPTKSVVKEFFGVNVDENLTNLKNGFNIVNDKPNRSLPASFSESGVRRFISEFNRLDIETQNQILETLYDNYAMLGLSMNVLPLSLIDILSFEITDEDKEYNKNFKLDEYRIHFRS